MADDRIKLVIQREYNLTPEQFLLVDRFIRGLNEARGKGSGDMRPFEALCSEGIRPPEKIIQDSVTLTDSSGTPSLMEAEVERAIPQQEAIDPGPKAHMYGDDHRVVTRILTDFKRSESLLVKEEKPNLSFAIFLDLIKGKCINCQEEDSFPCEALCCRECPMDCPCKTCEQERPTGLCFTRMEPRKIFMEYGLTVTPVYWLSKRGDGKRSLDPNNLGKIAFVINEFLARSRNPVLMIEGIEYIILNSGFDAALKFIDDINESIMAYKARFILPISPSTVEAKQLSRLERFMKVLDPTG